MRGVRDREKCRQNRSRMQSRARAGHERGGGVVSFFPIFFFFFIFLLFPVGSDLKRDETSNREDSRKKGWRKEANKRSGGGRRREKGLKLGHARPEVGERSTNPPRTGSKELRFFTCQKSESNKVGTRTFIVRTL